MSYFSDASNRNALELYIDGSNHGYFASWDGEVEVGRPFTAMAWFKRHTNTASIQSFFGYGPNGDEGQLYRWQTNPAGTSYGLDFGGSTDQGGSYSLGTGDWHHLTFLHRHPEHDSTKMQFLFNAQGPAHVHDFSGSDEPTNMIQLLGRSDSDRSFHGWIAEFKFWPFALQGWEEVFRAEMWAKGPVTQPSRCLYFPFDSRYGLSDTQGRGLRFVSSGAAPVVFDSEHPSGLTPAQFAPWDFLPGAPAVGGASVYEQVAFRFRNDDGSLGMPP